MSKIVQKSIYEIQTQDQFLKFKTDCLPIDKIRADFVQYDNSKPTGEKIKASAEFYIDVPDAKLLANDILSGRIPKLIKEEKKKDEKYPKAVWKLQGGRDAKTCKEKNIRDDGKCLARVMSLCPGSKYPYVFKIEQGPGEQTEEGLIVPCWKGKAEIVIYIPTDENGLKKLALMLNSYIDAYVTLSLSEKNAEKGTQKNVS